MATTNPVFQVLVTSGNQAPLAAAATIDTLAVGQIGVFDYHTGQSLGSGSIVGDTREIFLAVGIDPLGVGSLQDVNKSAGQVIQVRNAKTYTLKGYVNDAAKVVDIYGFKARCQSDYSVKIEFRNGDSYAINGFNQFTKTFNYTTGCCTDECVECAEGNTNELATGIITSINADEDQLATAQYVYALISGGSFSAGASADGTATLTIGGVAYKVPVVSGDTAAQVAQKFADVVNAGSAYTVVVSGANVKVYARQEGVIGTDTVVLTSAGGTSVAITGFVALAKTAVSVAGYAAFVAANPGVNLGVRITATVTPIRNYFQINLRYEKLRNTNIIVSTPDGFNCNGTVTTISELIYSEGKGYDLQQLEYLAGGWNGKPSPYRVSETTGTARGGFVYFASLATNYQILSLTYDQFSVGGWLEYLNNLETIVAIPCADTTTLTGLTAILDAIFTQFQPKTNDATDLDCSNISTNQLALNKNGISSLS